MKPFSSLWSFVRRHKWKLLIAAMVLLPIVAIAWYAFTPKAPSYITEDAKRGDLRQTVEAVGTVISERDLELQFPVPGIVSQIYIKEGDTVQAGQRLIALRAGDLAADVSAAAARLQAAEADLRAREEGSRTEDIAITQAEVESRRASLASAETTLQNAKNAYALSESKIALLQAEIDTALSGQTAAVGSTVSSQATAALNALSSIRGVLRNNDITDAVIRQENNEYQFIQTSLNSAESSLSNALNMGTPQTHLDALSQLDSTRSAVNTAINAANRVFNLIESLSQTAYLSTASRDTYKATIATNRGYLQTALSTLDTAINTLRNASASYDSRLAAERSSLSAAEGAMQKATIDIATYEAALRIAQAQLNLKRAPTRATDLDVAKANVRQARASLYRAQSSYSNTILTAPITGRVTKIAVKSGEALPAGPVVTLLGESPFRVEMFVSEIDIPRVQVAQTGSVKLDAYNDVSFALRTSTIDVAPTNKDGVNKYRVRLDFVYPHDELKIGMTGDAEIITGGVTDVITIPIRAVLERDDGTPYIRILSDDGTVEQRDVEVGLEGEGSLVEVSNVEEGETIIVLERD